MFLVIFKMCAALSAPSKCSLITTYERIIFTRMADSVVLEYVPIRFSGLVYFKRYTVAKGKGVHFRIFGFGRYNKMRTYRRYVPVPMVFVVLVIAGFEYYYFKRTPFINQHSQCVIVDVGKSDKITLPIVECYLIFRLSR